MARRAAGFTLIEVMVALAVFSLAALALLRLEGASIRAAGMVDAALAAQIVARNVAIEAMTDAAPPASRASGTERNAGRDWRWTRTAAALGDAGAVRIDVTVRGPGGAASARTTMIRPPEPAAVQ